MFEALVGALIGFVLCFWMAATVQGQLEGDRIKAGYWVRDGHAYRITPILNPGPPPVD